MSIDPLSFAQARYSGTPGFRTVNDPRVASGNPANKYMGRRFVPLSFNWLVYFTAQAVANIAVPIDVSGGSSMSGLLDKIEAVKIDNSNSTISISVFFPDTGDLVTCPPNTVATLPVMTNGLKCWVIAQGLAAGFTPTTTIYLINYPVIPIIDPQLQTTFPQELATPSIQTGLNQQLTPGYAPRALGDAMYTVDWTIGAPGTVQSILSSPRADGYFVITGIQFNVLNAQASPPALNNIVMESTGTAGILFSFWHLAFQSQVINQSVYAQSGLQLRIPANQTWRMRNVGPLGLLSPDTRAVIYIQYTYNPD